MSAATLDGGRLRQKPLVISRSNRSGSWDLSRSGRDIHTPLVDVSRFADPRKGFFGNLNKQVFGETERTEHGLWKLLANLQEPGRDFRGIFETASDGQ
jgi:hypothetical protein